MNSELDIAGKVFVKVIIDGEIGLVVQKTDRFVGDETFIE